MAQNHSIFDVTFFDDAIEEFAHNYEWFVNIGEDSDDLGRTIIKYDKKTIRGSLQPQKSSLNLKREGNTTSQTYDFYCKSTYRINIGDFIVYNNKYLMVDGVGDYDEWGVRNCTLTMVNLNEHQDFQDYLKYLNGEKTR